MDSLTSIDQSFFDFVWSSGIFAKIILLTLFTLSLAAWTITLSKTTQFANLLRKLRIVFDEPGDNSNSALQKLLADSKTPIGRIYRQGNRVVKSSLKAIARGQSASLVLEEVKQQVDIATDEEISQLSKGLSFLGTVITVSPFLGLLGTVWGVMQAFVSIADSGNADLSTLAPGIAEALITTIAGLVVAIPAVFCYNFLNTRLKRIEDSLYRLSTELSLYFAKRWDHEKTKI
ncbi:MAG: MotA/TolQ/ExbB proton channel family protein [Calditrichota bacterium]